MDRIARVLIVGSGAREHALYWKICQSPLIERVFCAPGNGGIPEVDRLNVWETDVAGIVMLAKEESIGLAVIGPEAPLAAGLADTLRGADIRVFGPNKAAAQLESSKTYMKKLCDACGIPTAAWTDSSRYEEADRIIRVHEEPLVIKADGLCGGKGVKVARTAKDAVAFAHKLMVERSFGEAGSTIIIEERLFGRECSIMALCDGKEALIFPPARDFKRALDEDAGENTGGMGAYSPLPDVGDALIQEIRERVFLPTLREMERRGAPFYGLLYAGLMLTKGGPMLLEFNVRFGDPETQVVLPRIESDLVPYLLACTEYGGLSKLPPLQVSSNAAVGITLASGGYPGEYQKGFPITGMADAERVAHIFHAGTERKNGTLLIAGGRVITVVGAAKTIEMARRRAYDGVNKISFTGMHHRTDIAANV